MINNYLLFIYDEGLIEETKISLREDLESTLNRVANNQTVNTGKDEIHPSLTISTSNISTKESEGLPNSQPKEVSLITPLKSSRKFVLRTTSSTEKTIPSSDDSSLKAPNTENPKSNQIISRSKGINSKKLQKRITKKKVTAVKAVILKVPLQALCQGNLTFK